MCLKKLSVPFQIVLREKLLGNNCGPMNNAPSMNSLSVSFALLENILLVI